MDFDLDGNLVLNRDGLALLIFTVALLFGGLASLITWLGLRSQYPQPRRRGQQIRRRIPAPRSRGQRGHLPMYVPGQARPLPPLPPLAVTAVQPALDENGCPR